MEIRRRRRISRSEAYFSSEAKAQNDCLGFESATQRCIADFLFCLCHTGPVQILLKRRHEEPGVQRCRAAQRLAGVRAAACFAACLSICVAAMLPAVVRGSVEEAQQPSSSAWELLRAKYYGDKSMGEVDETYVSVEAPANTPDPAATPLTLRFADDDRRRIKRVRVFIDNNPSPLVATFDFADAIPVTQIDMRVRIDRFTSVRAVAETADGRLEMRSTWVKASGGCSAPPSAAAGGVLGEIHLRSSADAKALQVGIRHPNASGFQIDPKTGDPIPAHYISHIRVTAGGTALLDADTGISLSENPGLRIGSDKSLPMPITVDAVDSETQAHYTASNGSR
jgi:sulfur-oxidizing protein SoxY